MYLPKEENHMKHTNLLLSDIKILLLCLYDHPLLNLLKTRYPILINEMYLPKVAPFDLEPKIEPFLTYLRNYKFPLMMPSPPTPPNINTIQILSLI